MTRGPVDYYTGCMLHPGRAPGCDQKTVFNGLTDAVTAVSRHGVLEARGASIQSHESLRCCLGEVVCDWYPLSAGKGGH